jgi:hypothetical protein
MKKLFKFLSEEKLVIALITGCVAVLGVCLYVLYLENKNCQEEGGKMVGNGERTTIITYTSNNIPVISTVENYECKK